MRAILQSLLVIAVTFVYVAGPYLTVEMEHSHEVSENHGHQHPRDDHDHSHHPHDEGSIPSSEAPDSDSTEGDCHSHTHVVSLDMDTPFATASHSTFVANRIGAYRPAAISELVPDGPRFSLIKPPQLG
jgi:ABC-type nickel/cobalt efflux system permease component RcnA